MGIGIMVMVAGCGTQTATSSPSKPASSSPASAMTKPPTSGTSVVSVKEIQTNKTAQMVEAGNPATFVLTAKTTAGHRASGVPVTFYVGPMMPLGSGVKTWYASGSSKSSTYIAHYSQKTNAQGQATITLKPQPTDRMEMVAVKIGNLSTFNAAAMTGSGLMDAWWTAPGTNPAAPVGDYVRVQPFAKVVAPGHTKTLIITAMSPQGPIPGATVDIIPKPSSKAMGAQSTMGGKMSSSGGKTMMTNARGRVMYTVKASVSPMVSLPLRVVVSNNMQRVAGGMSADILSQ